MPLLRTCTVALLSAFLAPAGGFAANGPAIEAETAKTQPPMLLVMFANQKNYKFFNPLPFPVWIKVYGSSSQGFPKVYKAPAPPAPFAPIPYPDTSMQIRVKVQGGNWSPKMKVNWKLGPISLKSLLGM